MTPSTDSHAIRETVRTRYAAAARAASRPSRAVVAARRRRAAQRPSVISSDLYTIDEVGELPPLALLASLGCGNPTAVAELKPGEVVLDLGSGAGI